MTAPYEKLRAWSASHELVLAVYKATSTWPVQERYGLTSQARRAAFSVAANIAEGGGKRGPRELRRFLDIALGSTAELQYILRLAHDLQILQDSDWRQLELSRQRAGKLLWRLYESVLERTRD